MLFAISLLIAGAFSILCGKALRKHPAPFYLTAAVLSIGTIILANTRISMPVLLQQNVISLFTKGILAAAFWAVVMWTGALPNSSALMKKLMPQRGQLSIFAAILTLGHAVGFVISIFPRWIQKADVLNLIICISLLLIMIPLTVISVQKIRWKMKAKTWKSVQRWAYLFYALILVHVIVLNIAKARNGQKNVIFSLLLYVAVFLGYAVCRIRKHYVRTKKPEKTAGLNAACGTVFALLFGACVFAALPKRVPDTAQTQTAEIAEQTDTSEATTVSQSQTTTFASVTTGAESQTDISETTSTCGTDSDTDTETTTTLQETAEPDEAEAAVTDAPFEAPAPEQRTEAPNTPAQQAETPAEPEPPAPVRIYQDGTFTASAYGYDGDITVHVTIQNDTVTDITAETEESDDSYFFDAKSVVIPAIIRSQAADVDACSGATYSSNGIMAAVRAALEQARI